MTASRRALLSIVLMLVAGCSELLQSDHDIFAERISAEYKTGTPVLTLEDALMRRGFRKSSPVRNEVDGRPAPFPQCLRHVLAYGFWGGGYRYVCYRASADGMIEELKSFDLVAGL